jgi:hypothetical protein
MVVVRLALTNLYYTLTLNTFKSCLIAHLKQALSY